MLAFTETTCALEQVLGVFAVTERDVSLEGCQAILGSERLLPRRTVMAGCGGAVLHTSLKRNLGTAYSIRSAALRPKVSWTVQSCGLLEWMGIVGQ